jgi:hypothetical protein
LGTNRKRLKIKVDYFGEEEIGVESKRNPNAEDPEDFEKNRFAHYWYRTRFKDSVQVGIAKQLKKGFAGDSKENTFEMLGLGDYKDNRLLNDLADFDKKSSQSSNPEQAKNEKKNHVQATPVQPAQSAQPTQPTRSAQPTRLAQLAQSTHDQDQDQEDNPYLNATINATSNWLAKKVLNDPDFWKEYADEMAAEEEEELRRQAIEQQVVDDDDDDDDDDYYPTNNEPTWSTGSGSEDAKQYLRRGGDPAQNHKDFAEHARELGLDAERQARIDRDQEAYAGMKHFDLAEMEVRTKNNLK